MAEPKPLAPGQPTPLPARNTESGPDRQGQHGPITTDKPDGHVPHAERRPEDTRAPLPAAPKGSPARS